MPVTRSALFTLAITLGLMAPLARSQSVPLEEGAFTAYMADSLRHETGELPVSVTAPLQVSAGDLHINLARLYAFCKNNASACPAQAQQYVQGVVQVIKVQNAPIDKASIRLVVRSRDYIEKAQASLGRDGPTLQFRPLVAGLVSVAVLDTPRAVRPLDNRDLARLGVSQEQLFDLARQNLHASLKPVTDLAKPLAAGQIGTLPADVYEVGRIASREEWDALAAAQNGTLLVALPTTDTVLYSASATATAVDALRVLAQDTLKKSPNPLSPLVLKWTREGWELAQ